MVLIDAIGEIGWQTIFANPVGKVSGFAIQCAARRVHYHVARVNTFKRMALHIAAGAASIDGSSGSRYAVTVPMLSYASRQVVADFEARWPNLREPFRIPQSGHVRKANLANSFWRVAIVLRQISI